MACRESPTKKENGNDKQAKNFQTNKQKKKEINGERGGGEGGERERVCVCVCARARERKRERVLKVKQKVNKQTKKPIMFKMLLCFLARCLI